VEQNLMSIVNFHSEIEKIAKNLFENIDKQILEIIQEVCIQYNFTPENMTVNILHDDVYQIWVRDVMYAQFQIKPKFIWEGKAMEKPQLEDLLK
jgi:hypothetical protein